MLALGGAGLAFAYWRAGGGGTGSGSTGNATLPITLAPGTATATLYPGGQSSVTLVASNPNSARIDIRSLALATGQGTGGFAVDADHAACSLSTLSYATQTNGGLGWTVPAKAGGVDGSVSITLPGALAMSLAAASACQNGTFSVYLVAGS